jgi:hypothetical protein
MASLLYNSLMYDGLTGAVDIDTDTFRMILVTSAYSPSKSHSKRNQITNEVTGTGYTAGGKVVVPTIALNNTTNRAIITIPQTIWTASTITARGGVVCKWRGGASSADELLCYVDFLQDIVTSNQTFEAPQSTLTQQN